MRQDCDSIFFTWANRCLQKIKIIVPRIRNWNRSWKIFLVWPISTQFKICMTHWTPVTHSLFYLITLSKCRLFSVSEQCKNKLQVIRAIIFLTLPQVKPQVLKTTWSQGPDLHWVSESLPDTALYWEITIDLGKQSNRTKNTDN